MKSEKARWSFSRNYGLRHVHRAPKAIAPAPRVACDAQRSLQHAEPCSKQNTVAQCGGVSDLTNSAGDRASGHHPSHHGDGDGHASPMAAAVAACNNPNAAAADPSDSDGIRPNASGASRDRMHSQFSRSALRPLSQRPGQALPLPKIQPGCRTRQR